MTKRSEVAAIDHDVLKFMEKHSEQMTYVICNRMNAGRAAGDRYKTSDMLRACRRLEKQGLAEELNGVRGLQKCWRITDAGRADLAEHDGREE